MGPLEIMAILVIAFIVLGPDRMIDAARFMGRMVGEGRRLASEMPRVVVEDDDIKVVSGDDTISVTRDIENRPAKTAVDSDQVRDKSEEDGPVAFTPDSGDARPDSDAPQSHEREKIP